MEKIMVPKYRAFDGTLFDEEDRCVRYESTMVDIRKIQMVLEPRPTDMDFMNGHGYIQHEPLPFNIAKGMIINLALKYISDEHKDDIRSYIKEHDIESPIHNPVTTNMFPKRLEYRGCSGHVVNFIVDRFCTTDKKLREWGQIYYAFNPERGEQICLNEKSPTM